MTKIVQSSVDKFKKNSVIILKGGEAEVRRQEKVKWVPLGCNKNGKWMMIARN